jgi:uncharacterized membrane protein YoaK (UPF0700 family)
MSADAQGLAARIAPRSVDSSPGLRLLPFVLGLIAGSSDVISFLGLGGLFTAHITGNMVILAAHVLGGGVSAMAVQNALVQVSLTGAPSTAAMTTNVTRFAMDVGEMLIGRDPAEAARSRLRAKQIWPAIVDFTIGCGLGAACESMVGLRSLALPSGLALVAIAMSFAASPDGGERR